MSSLRFFFLFCLFLFCSNTGACQTSSIAMEYGRQISNALILCPYLLLLKSVYTVVQLKEFNVPALIYSTISAIASLLLITVYTFLLCAHDVGIIVLVIVFIIELCASNKQNRFGLFKQSFGIYVISFLILFSNGHSNNLGLLLHLLNAVFFSVLTYNYIALSINLEERILLIWSNNDSDVKDACFWSTALVLTVIFSVYAAQMLPIRLEHAQGFVYKSATYSFKVWPL